MRHAFDGPHDLGRLFLHTCFRGERLSRVQLVVGKLLPRQAGKSRCSLGFCSVPRLGFRDLAFHVFPKPEQKWPAPTR